MAFYKCARIYVTENSNTEINTASGPIANFNTLLATPLLLLKANFKATQDLHGQSGPYPAGGSAQIWDEQWEVGTILPSSGQNTPSTTRIRSVNYANVKPSTTYKLICSSTYNMYFYQEDYTYIGFVSKNANETFTTPDNCYYIRFTPGTEYGTTYKNDISLNYPSTDTAYHPYSNICPISGVTGAKIGYVDFNQFVDNGNFESIDYWIGYNGTLSVTDNVMSYVVTTVKNSNLNRVASTGVKSYPLPIVLGHKYFISFSIKTPYNQGTSFQSYITNPTVGDSHQGIRMTSLDTVANTWTRYCRVGIGEGTGYGDIRLGVHSSNETAIGDTSYLKNVIFIDLTQAFGSTVADYLYSLSDNGLSIIKQIFTKDYYAYNEGGSMVTVDSVNGEPTCPNAVINLGGTYYGGYVSQDKDGKRELVVTHSDSVDLNTLTFYRATFSGNSGFYADLPNGLIKGTGSSTIDGLCTNYKVTSQASMPEDKSCRFYSHTDWGGFSRIAIRDDDTIDMTGEEFTAYVTGQICYEIQNPQTIALPDGERIKSFAGINNIYADTGDTTIEYRNLTQGG